MPAQFSLMEKTVTVLAKQSQHGTSEEFLTVVPLDEYLMIWNLGIEEMRQVLIVFLSLLNYTESDQCILHLVFSLLGEDSVFNQLLNGELFLEALLNIATGWFSSTKAFIGLAPPSLLHWRARSCGIRSQSWVIWWRKNCQCNCATRQW